MSGWEEAQQEVSRALELHGAKSMHAAPPLAERRIRILLEEVGEVAKEFNDAEVEGRPINVSKLRRELVQVTSLSGGWVDSIDAASGVTE